jgi:thiamine biosynthesis lipoprotein
MKYFLPAVALLLHFSTACTPTPPPRPQYKVEGEAQGTTYTIKYISDAGEVLRKEEVDSLLRMVDLSLSAWVEGSVLSQFNRADTFNTADPMFLAMFFRGRELSELTGGAFHPMVMPLVRAWGFGPDGAAPKEGIDVDSVRALVHFNFTAEPVDNTYIHFVKAPGQQIDVNGYAQGYAVDLLGELLEQKGLGNYLVELGGEIMARGTNATGEPWQVGIDKPVAPEATRELQAVVALTNRAMATSGNYRKFYMKDGLRYPHTIDPATGYPVQHSLMSVTVLAPNCTNADAFATAFLVMGEARTREFIKAHPELQLDVYLISDGGNDTWTTWASEGMAKGLLREAVGL